MRILIFIMALLLASCGSDTQNSTSTDVTISLGQSSIATGAIGQVGSIPANIQSVSLIAINASGATIAGPVVANRPNFTLKINVPNGNNIRFRILAFSQKNATGIVLYETLSAPVNLTGKPIVVPVKMSLSIKVAANTLNTFRGGLVNLAGRVSGNTPNASNPLLWTTTGGTLTNTDPYGAINTWTAPNTLGKYTVAAHIDPAANPDQDPTIKGTVQISVLNRDPYIDTFNTTPIVAYTGATSTFPLIIAGDFDGDKLQVASPNKPSWVTLITQGTNPLNVALELTPPLGTSGNFTFLVGISDGLGGNISKNITITINNNIPAPAIAVSSPLTYTSTVDIYGYALIGSNVDIYADGNLIATVQPSTFSEFTLLPNMGDFFHTATNIPNGTHTITAYARFGSNLSPKSNSVLILVDALLGTPLTSTNLITAAPTSIATADLNGDFYADIILGDSAGNVYIYLGDNTSGIIGTTPTTIPTGAAGMNQFAIGDVNNDTYTDIVLPSATNNTITILTGNAVGAPTLQASLPIDAYSEPFSAAIADMNNDGYADIITANHGSILGVGTGTTVSTLSGSSQGFFLDPPLTITGQVGLSSITAFYLNFDSYADAAIAGASVAVVENTTGGVPTITSYAATSPTHITTGFLNFDSPPDIVTCNSDNSITVLLSSLGGFPTSTTYFLPFGSIPKWSATGDMNGDFYDDIVVAVSGTNTIAVFINDGLGNFNVTPPAIYPILDGIDPSSIALKDIDNDLKLDVIIANSTSKNISLFLNTSIFIPFLNGG